MTQQAITTNINSRASIDARVLVLPRAQWESEMTSQGLALRPQKGTWYGHVVRGKGAHDVSVVPMLGCPNCGGIVFLANEPAAETLRRMSGMPVPASHKIDHLGRVTPDVRCTHVRARCEFHRRIILDRWLKSKALYAVAYIDLTKGEHGEIEIDHCHAVDRREALFHFGQRKNVRIIDAGPAVGFFVDEKTGKVTAQ